MQPLAPVKPVFCALLSASLFGLGCANKKTEPAAKAEHTAKDQAAAAETSVSGSEAAPNHGVSSAKASAAPLPVKALPSDKAQSSGKLELAIRQGGTGSDDVRGLAIDDKGDTLICGYFRGDGIFGEAFSSKDPSGYVAKLSGKDGSPKWAVALSGDGPNVANALAVATDGSTVVVGSFGGELTIGNGTLTSAGADDIFIVKVAADGHRLWAKRIGSYDIDGASAVAVDKVGNIYVVGVFRGEVAFDGEKIKSVGNSDIFLSKIAPGGEYLWTKTFGDMGQDFARDIKIDSAGNIVLLAEISLKVSFGGKALATSGNRDIALVKLDRNGEHIWSKVMGNNFDDIAISLALDPADNIIFAGSFEDVVNLGGADLTSKGRSDLDIAKYDTNGKYLWSESFGGKDKDWANNIASDSFGNIYVTGWFWYQVDFGGISLTSKGKEDAFLAKLSPTGSVLWAKSFGDTSLDKGKVVATTAEQGVIAAGAFNNQVVFEDTILTPNVAANSKVRKGDIYVSRFSR